MTGELLQFDSVAQSGLHRVAPRSPGATGARTQGGAEVQVSFQSTDRGSGCPGVCCSSPRRSAIRPAAIAPAAVHT